MKNKEEEKIRVVDKRFSSGAGDTQAAASSIGDGFVMKEKPEVASGPNEVDFATFVFSLATGAVINLGYVPDPTTKKTQKNLDLAKQNIDILAILQEKTRGNLSEEEKTLLDQLLTEVRLKFVEASKKP